MNKSPIYFEELNSPVGPITIVANDKSLTGVWFKSLIEKASSNAITKECKKQLKEYFKGTRKEFDLPLAMNQGTAFQNSVWKALLKIPYGKTSTYGNQARMVKKPKAVRAVGAANGRNPISIVVPCHRIIGADGSLTGFGGGIEAKKWLLEHERLHTKRLNLDSATS